MRTNSNSHVVLSPYKNWRGECRGCNTSHNKFIEGSLASHSPPHFCPHSPIALVQIVDDRQRERVLPPPPSSLPPPPPPLPPKTPPRALALTPKAVNAVASPAANASVGTTVFPSSRSSVAFEMYDTVIGRRQRREEQRLNDVHSPAVYKTAAHFPIEQPITKPPITPSITTSNANGHEAYHTTLHQANCTAHSPIAPPITMMMPTWMATMEGRGGGIGQRRWGDRNHG